VPKVVGHPELASHIAQSVIQQDFDLTIVNKMDVDHGLTVPLSLMCGEQTPRRRLALPGDPVRRQRGAVPVPSGQRCFNLGRPSARPWRASTRHQRAYLGHRRHEPPAAGRARRPDQREWDNQFLDLLIADPPAGQMPHIDYVREAGSKASSW
jgi:protocatechuate 4,5-dioxygenase beta chain